MTQKNISHPTDSTFDTTTEPAVVGRSFVPHAPDIGYDGRGKATSDCGDSIEFFLSLSDEKVTGVSCKAHGCDNTKLSAKAAGLLVKSQSIKDAFKISTPENIDALAKLPKANKHCADLAAKAIRAALRSAVRSAREPWRRLYRRH